MAEQPSVQGADGLNLRHKLNYDSLFIEAEVFCPVAVLPYVAEAAPCHAAAGKGIRDSDGGAAVGARRSLRAGHGTLVSILNPTP